MDHRAPSPLRFLAPLALIATALVFFLLIAGSLGGSDTEAPTTGASQQEASRGSGAGDDEGPRTYEVEEGDTLEGIAADTGVSVEKIQELNPDLDPQALVAGEELKLRE